ncbi:MAG: class I SAM-dependent methyltransferase [Anaerolineaceae bacterium]
MKQPDYRFVIPTLPPKDLPAHLERCLETRQELLANNQQQAVRLFNGFYEGLPGLVIDLYASTLVVANHAKVPETLDPSCAAAIAFYQKSLPWLEAALVKQRHSADPLKKKGVLVFGNRPADRIVENGVRYVLNLRLNQDCSFYLDTRNLRTWLLEHVAGKSILNCFAYTGALGIAALVGNANQVIQTDLNNHALQLAKKSASLNQFTGRMGTLPLDFFKALSRFKTNGDLFDCVILDPPLFSSTGEGTVSLLDNWLGLINKARPLVAHGGCLIAINNALYLSGKDMMDQLEKLTTSGYVQIEEIIPVPEDVTGYSSTVCSSPPSSPAPFNHPTKIVILRIARKDGRQATR